MANKFISHSLKQRNLDDTEGERTVEVSEEVLNLLHFAHYFSKKKGKALFMLSASRELGVIKRKRKRSFKAFDPLEDKEESKEYRQKRGKFREENNVKITDWLIQNHQRKTRQIKSIKMKETIMNQEMMKIWILIWIRQKQLIPLLRNNNNFMKNFTKINVWKGRVSD